MPIAKNTITGEIILTPPNRADLLAQTGVANNGNFAICDKTDYLKQMKFDPSAQATNTTLTVASGPITQNTTITLPSSSGTVSTTAFATIQVPSGTSPTASGPSDTLTFTSSDNSVTITGNATTDTINFQAAGGVGGVNVIGTIDSQSPSANGAVISTPDLYMQSASGTAPGLVNTTTQTFAGAKTFSGGISASSLTLSSTPLNVASGGTGLSTITQYNLLTGNGTSSLSLISPTGSQYSPLVSNDSSSAPSFQALNLAQSAAVTGILPNANTTAATGATASAIVQRDSAGNIVSPGFASSGITSVNHAASPYAATATDRILLVDTSAGAVTITLPAPTNYRAVKIIDSTGNFGTNNVTLKPHASELIQGVASSITVLLSAAWGNYEFSALDNTNWYKTSAASNFATLTFTASGSWVVPPGVTSATCAGRGGAGGGATGGSGAGGSNASSAGGGGAGGPGGSAFSTKRDIILIPGATVTVTIGAGGTGQTGSTAPAANSAGTSGTAGTNGGIGGSTTVAIAGGNTYLWAGGTGGNAGASGTLSAGGAGGSAGFSPFIGQGTAGGAGGAPGAAGSFGSGNTSSPRKSPFCNPGANAAGGASAGATSGGGGGGTSGAPGGDELGGVAIVGSVGGAGGGPGSAGSISIAPNAAGDGDGGMASGGGGGGGLGTYTFTVTSANATAGATYTNSAHTYTVLTTISGGTTLVTTGTGTPAASGSLVLASGSGDATITYSAFTTAGTQGGASANSTSGSNGRVFFMWQE